MDSHFVDELVEMIARRLRRNVVLDDPQSNLLAYSTITDSIDRARRYHLLMKISVPEVRPRQAEANSRVTPFLLPPDPEAGFFGRLGVPLIDEHHHVGTLWVQADDYTDPLDEPAELLPEAWPLLHQLAAHLGQDQHHARRHRAHDASLVRMLRDSDAVQVRRIVAQRVEGRLITLVLIPCRTCRTELRETQPHKTEPRTRNEWPAPEARQRILTRLLVTLSSGLRHAFVGGADSDHAVLILPSVTREAELQELAARARHHSGDEMPVVRMALGISDPWEEDSDPTGGYRQALIAAQAQTVDPAVSAAWSRIGVYRYLATAGEAISWATGRLQLLHDAPDGALLADTLEAMYDSSRPKADLARSMHLHRATLYNRLHRIERIIGADPMAPEVRLELHLALKARRWSERPSKLDPYD